jgi:hypothetical protein
MDILKPTFSITYPEDPVVPDRLITTVSQLSPDREVVTFRYPHPVIGKLWKG